MPSDSATALPAPPDAILFDLDGTIIDSRVPFVDSMNYALAAQGQRQRKPEELWQYLGDQQLDLVRRGVEHEIQQRACDLVRLRRAG